MFKAVGAYGMYRWIYTMSMHSYAIAHHQELKERSDGKAILELKEELSKL